MSYSLETTQGPLIVPPSNRIMYKGLEIIGKDEPNWNKPIQQSLVTLRDMIDANVGLELAENLLPVNSNAVDVGSPSKLIRSLHLGVAGVYLGAIQALSVQSGATTLTGAEDDNVKIVSKGVGSVNLLSTGTGNINIKSDLMITSGKVIKAAAGVPIAIANPVNVTGNLSATTVNGINTTTLALKSEIPSTANKVTRDTISVARVGGTGVVIL